jgi:hypothetical protein
MKNRITLTIDPAVVMQAKKAARARNTTMSGLVEQLLRSTSISGEEKQGSFVDQWAGKFSVAESLPNDPRMAFLKTKHGLTNR